MLGRSLESFASQRGPHCLLHFGHFGLRRVLSQRVIPLVLWRRATAALDRHLGRVGKLKEVRSIRLKDLSGCSQSAHGSTCTRCPGLPFREGNMGGPSTADCEKSFARTGIPSVNLLTKRDRAAAPRTGADSARTGDHRQSALGNGRPWQCSSLIAGATPVRSSRILR